MSLALVLLGLGLLYYWADTESRRVRKNKETARQELRIKKTDHRITYLDLASQFRDLTTARNMIALGLVKENHEADDKYVRLIYEGYFSEENEFQKNYRAKFFSHKYGLTPTSSNYVGAHPKDPKRRAPT